MIRRPIFRCCIRSSFTSLYTRAVDIPPSNSPASANELINLTEDQTHEIKSQETISPSAEWFIKSAVESIFNTWTSQLQIDLMTTCNIEKDRLSDKYMIHDLVQESGIKKPTTEQDFKKLTLSDYNQQLDKLNLYFIFTMDNFVNEFNNDVLKSLIAKYK